jgi:RNA polymerase sigma factor (sigma-70 family)
MAGARLGPALWHIQQLFRDGSATGLSDTQLLRRFAVRRDEAAFAAVVARHGPMVMAVCRAILRDPYDAEDAFQATFLVLARKAGTAWTEGQLGGWLHTVAYRIAVRASTDSAIRHRHERQAAREAVGAYAPVELDDLRPALHEEIARLPARFRLPIVLCYFEGLTHVQAAVHLGCGEATVRRRLAVARERLRLRLAQRGLAPMASVFGASLTRHARGTVSAVCAEVTIRAAMRIAAGEAIANVVSARVSSLSRGGLNLITNGWKASAFTVLSLAAVAGLAGVVGARDDMNARQQPEAPGATKAVPVFQRAPMPISQSIKTAPRPTNRPDAGEVWPLTLDAAIRIALDNADFVRVVAFSDPSVPVGDVPSALASAGGKKGKSRSARVIVQMLDADAFVWDFKAQIMAKLRAVEEQYWNLSQSHALLWCADGALKMHQETLKGEKAKQNANAANIAEVEARLEACNLDLVTRTSDVITTERELRNLLGLPAADNRRIVPATNPTEKSVKFKREACVAEMMEEHPEIVLKKLAIAEFFEPTTFIPGSVTSNAETEWHENHRKALQKQLQPAIEQQTHALARSLLSVDESYRHFATAQKLRSAADQRLDAQRAYFDEGRITIDRFLDAVSQYYTVMATESQYRVSYNIALLRLSEAKGTLLADRDIVVVEEVGRPRKLIGNENKVRQTGTVAVSSSTGGGPDRIPAAAAAAPPALPRPESATIPEKSDTTSGNNKTAAATKTAPKSWSFSFSIGRDRPFVIKGTIFESADSGPGAADR